IIFHVHPGGSCSLLPGEVHLWLATVDHVPDLSLSAAEQIKLSAMKLPFVARRFESTRKLLRYLLRAYLNCPDGHIEKTDQGKPFLPEFPEFHFNVTHSKKMIMVALSRGPVGVDLERMRELDVLAVAKRFFSPQELFFLQNLSSKSTDAANNCVAPVLASSSISYTLSRCAPSTPCSSQASATLKTGSQEEDQAQNQPTFFKLWTAKEAALKADGGGIASGMKNNVAAMEDGNVSSIILGKRSWKISSWNLSEGGEIFFGAVATSFVPAVIHWYDLRTFDKINS
ncbi:MAG: 4'-phosphopantetheinyl transferase superfamily protein, partial [Verrucomicrobiota bacterium]